MGFTACSLTNCIDNWRDLNAPNQVIDWLSEGVPLTFSSPAPTFSLENHKLTPTQSLFVDQEVTRLLSSGAIALCKDKPQCVSPLGVVPKKRNKLRLILDLRKLNGYCVVPKFRYEDISTALEIVEPHDVFITADLQNGFHHLKVRNSDQKFFGFCWKNKYYM